MRNLYRFHSRPVHYFHVAMVSVAIILGINLVEQVWVTDDQFKLVFSDLVSAFINLIATGCLYAAARQSFAQSKELGKAWTVLTIAQLAFALGDIIWAILEVGMGVSPFPSIADIFYLIYYPLFLIGIFLLPARQGTFNDMVKRLIDITVVMVAAILIFWNFLIGPLALQTGDELPLETFLNMAYPIGDLILLWALLVLMYNRTGLGQETSLWFLAGAVTAQIIIDCLFSYQSLMNTYASGGLLDLGWILAYLFIALAGLFQAVSVHFGPDAENQFHASLRTFRSIPTLLPYFPYLWLSAAFALLIFGHSNPLPMDFSTLATGVTMVIGLIVIRQMLTLSENNRLNAQLQLAIDDVQQKAQELRLTNHELQEEITERKTIEEQLAHDALHDGLTGLANRILFMDRLGQAIAYTRRRKDYTFSVVFLDMDHFKVVNDSLGHGLGDQLLIAISQRLKMCLRTSDTVARFGGDEFVVLLENTVNQQTVLSTSNRILEEMATPFHLDGHVVHATVSMGIVPNLLGYDRAEDVLRDADIAMYRAKELGKARFEIFNADMRMQAIARLQLENELRHAIDAHEFQVYYQPIFSLDSQQLIAFEALLRWNHPTRGLLRPNDFMQVVEEAGFIQPLGKWILREACSRLYQWHQRYPHLRHLKINVNISGKQMVQVTFAEQIQQILSSVGLSPSALNLEITESVFMVDSASTSGFFARLNQLGIRFQIDDFGTGFSSLSYLQRFPVHTIKIDKSFIHKIGKDGKSQELIRAIISMARDLGMYTTAEGLETQAQLNEMKKLGCTNGQGFFLGRPMPEMDVEQMLSLMKTAPEPGPLQSQAAA